MKGLCKMSVDESFAFIWIGSTTVQPDGTVLLPDGTTSHMGPGRGLDVVRQEWLENPAGQRFLARLESPPSPTTEEET